MNARLVSPRSTRFRSATHAVAFTATVAIVAWFLAGVAGLSETAVVVSVMVVAFTGSWVVTGAREIELHQQRHHRVTMIPIRSRAG